MKVEISPEELLSMKEQAASAEKKWTTLINDVYKTAFSQMLEPFEVDSKADAEKLKAERDWWRSEAGDLASTLDKMLYAAGVISDVCGKMWDDADSKGYEVPE